ncbi:nitric oxide synthase oxygenase [Sandaracinobacteroides saxicola]|uniref:Nitric oxide synthase oxygenase n=1 Tax=Sandaracinobacteroides saxicola TaxID=2759707 RepID=A0A7G5IDN1_9SPHN|nr:nitric oxide synthase oxygenase [Sandaracinobacteroides saxicola]QMW21473.1 nitric oxide synthase oxygenase [Sandaracinobacteroides saxicola]
MDSFVSADPVQRRLRRLGRGERREEAVAFLRQFARETGMAPETLAAREAEVRAALRRHGHYAHSIDELAFGARVAWRNHARCIGRLRWKSLAVRDCRDVTEPAAIAERMFAHVAEAAGRSGAAISIFAAAAGGVPATIENAQMFQYAGWIGEDGAVLGDRRNVELARIAIALGWRPPARRTAFDLLPLIVRDSRGHRHLFPLPPGLAKEVPIRHPTLAGLEALGLRWYSVPCVTNMVLTIGGIDYPCAPFNGYYMATEIASRNLADQRRFDLLPQVADALGMDRGDQLWRDMALTELNRAVLWSFGEAGAAIVDHHVASAEYMEFARLEQRAGRVPSGDWTWIVPPQASAACPVFHLPMTDMHAVPNFYVSRQLDGGALRLDRSLERQGRWLRRFRRWQARWRDWRRRRDAIWHRS